MLTCDIVIPDVISVAETNDFDLSRERNDWLGQDPFHGLLCEDPRNHIEEFEDLASRSEQNEISVDHILYKIFPYSLSGDAFRWFRQLQPGSLTCWEDITSAFFNKFIYEAATNLEIEMRSMLEYMVEDDEQYGFEEPSRVEEADTRDLASQSIGITTSPSYSADSTQKSTDVSSCDLVPDVDREITMEDFLELKDEAQSENLDRNLENDLETLPEASLDRHHPSDIDRYPSDYIDRYPPDDINRHPGLGELSGYIVELEPIEERMHELWFHALYLKLNLLFHLIEICSSATTLRYWMIISIEASQRGLRFRDEVDKGPTEAASIDTDQIPSNDTTDAISNDINKSALIDATTTPSIDTGHVSEQKEFDVCGNLFDGETTTQSNNSGGKKRRNWKKRKRTKGGSQPLELGYSLTAFAAKAFMISLRISVPTHDPVKIVVPCTVFEVEFLIPPDKGAHLSSYIKVLDDHQHREASQRGLQFRDEVDKGPAKEFDVCGNHFYGETTTRSDKSGGKKRRNWKKRKRTKGGSQLSLIPRFSDGVRKYKVSSRCFAQPFAKLHALLFAEMIDKGEESMEEAFIQE
ncbi:hypothetical protein F2Q68_00021106 [Brassica cretica]|uniref:Retrotransposon gag domain-containing protein n=1 Tax=Brassica cretica TaxID=69181 RepID=A0A8S9FUU5_BRACR|nr:hypothetical protein F2Q68_00021106 [Brassica cretica]